MAYSKFLKTGTFKSAIREWNKRPQTEKTWVSFKEHFRLAQQELRETNGLEIGNAGLDQANLVQQVLEGMQTMMRPTKEENNMADEYMNSVANLAMNQKEILPTLLEQMKQMQETMMQMQ